MCRPDDFPPFPATTPVLKRASDVRVGDRLYAGVITAIIRRPGHVDIAAGPAPSPWLTLAAGRLIPVLV